MKLQTALPHPAGNSTGDLLMSVREVGLASQIIMEEA
jgi:hypothetical protein